MRKDYQQIKDSYSQIYPELEKIAVSIEKELERIMSEVKHVDRVTCRCKSIESFMGKTEKVTKNGDYKYEVPLKEIQDKIGARIIVYYKSDIETIHGIVSQYFRRIEETIMEPDDISKFGYEGFHMVCKIPNTIAQLKDSHLIGDFFELQIKTLYQHAWSQSNHGLGYKPGQGLRDEEVRLLAFIAAQSWGADKGLVELAEEKGKA